jgi:hypothetical protein
MEKIVFIYRFKNSKLIDKEKLSLTVFEIAHFLSKRYNLCLNEVKICFGTVDDDFVKQITRVSIGFKTTL